MTQPEEHAHRVLSTRPMHLLTDVLAIALLISVVFIIYNFSSKNQTATTDFTFTWGPDRQKIVNGTLRMEISLKTGGENVTFVIRLNDDDYNGYDCLGLVFDSNGNSYIDVGDDSNALYANNLTAPSILVENGFLGIAQVRPTTGPQKVTFSQEGYIFEINFSAPALKQAVMRGLMHVCFVDETEPPSGGSAGVYARFTYST